MSAYFVVELSACHTRSAKREEEGYIFVVVFCSVWCLPPPIFREKPRERHMDVRYQKEDDRGWTKRNAIFC